MYWVSRNANMLESCSTKYECSLRRAWGWPGGRAWCRTWGRGTRQASHTLFPLLLVLLRCWCNATFPAMSFHGCSSTLRRGHRRWRNTRGCCINLEWCHRRRRLRSLHRLLLCLVTGVNCPSRVLEDKCARLAFQWVLVHIFVTICIGEIE